MDNLPVIPITNVPDDSRDRKVNSNITQNKTADSPDFLLSFSPYGSFLKQKPSHKKTQAVNVYPDYVPTGSYYPGQVVRVTAALVSSSAYLSQSYGVWCCVATIPEYGYDTAITNAGLSLSNYAGQYRVAGCLYYPHWPEPSVMASATNPSGSYWKLIGMLPVSMSACVNGTQTTIYVGAIATS